MFDGARRGYRGPNSCALPVQSAASSDERRRYGREVQDILVSATLALRTGEVEEWPLAGSATPTPQRCSRGRCGDRRDLRGKPGDPAMIGAEMDKIAAAREDRSRCAAHRRLDLQDPPGHKAWALTMLRAAGNDSGGAQVSKTLHLLNLGSATSADIEALSEEAVAGCRQTNITLEWEIQRIGTE